jgi:putative transposase
MPRSARLAAGNVIYHCMNRSSGGFSMFKKDADYIFFESLLEEGKELIDMRILAYCIMPNHWHLLLYPKNDGDMSDFMHWITTSHVRNYRSATDSVGYGHLYQGVYKSFPVETERYMQTVVRYIEQNPLRANLVKDAKAWRWSSLWRRKHNDKKILSDLPIELPSDYLSTINVILNKDIKEKINHSIKRGTPFGPDNWVDDIVKKYGMESTIRKRGRPFGS